MNWCANGAYFCAKAFLRRAGPSSAGFVEKESLIKAKAANPDA
ncbi:hypothetical protein MHI18_10810 [Peribacillus sp. FSL H8-0477]